MQRPSLAVVSVTALLLVSSLAVTHAPLTAQARGWGFDLKMGYSQLGGEWAECRTWLCRYCTARRCR